MMKSVPFALRLAIVILGISSCSSISGTDPASHSFVDGNDHLLSELIEEYPYLPLTSDDDMLVTHQAYSLSYLESVEQALWVAYRLDYQMITGDAERKDNFTPDPQVPTGSSDLFDFKGSGYDRGHLAPAADMKLNQLVMDESFYLSNITPQLPSFNRYIWKDLEALVRSWVTPSEPLYVVTGPLFFDDPIQTIGDNRVGIPTHFYKAVFDFTGSQTRAIAFLLPHDAAGDFDSYVLSVDELEQIVEVDFFPVVQDDVEIAAESYASLVQWTTTTGGPAEEDPEGEPGVIEFLYVVASPTEAEEIVLINRGSAAVDVSGWSLGDLNNPAAMHFVSGSVIGSGEQVRFTRDMLNFQINNSGEILYLMNRGEVIATWRN
jgi:endonuclease G